MLLREIAKGKPLGSDARTPIGRCTLGYAGMVSILRAALLARRFWWAMMPHDDFSTLLPPADIFVGFRRRNVCLHRRFIFGGG